MESSMKYFFCCPWNIFDRRILVFVSAMIFQWSNLRLQTAYVMSTLFEHKPLILFFIFNSAKLMTSWYPYTLYIVWNLTLSMTVFQCMFVWWRLQKQNQLDTNPICAYDQPKKSKVHYIFVHIYVADGHTFCLEKYLL